MKTEAIFEETMVKNVSNQIKDIKPLIQGATQIPRRINANKNSTWVEHSNTPENQKKKKKREKCEVIRGEKKTHCIQTNKYKNESWSFNRNAERI